MQGELNEKSAFISELCTKPLGFVDGNQWPCFDGSDQAVDANLAGYCDFGSAYRMKR